MIKDGTVTPDGFVVNTIDPISTPHDLSVKSLGTVTPISRPIATPLRLEIALFEDLREGWCRSCG
jgi:hypothetical protein